MSDHEVAQRVCSWCGEIEEGDGVFSGCCGCDVVPASQLPALLRAARAEHERCPTCGQEVKP